ncbi:MAG: alpha/beta fold hydrolase, partial [Acidimicrobiales bacterium]
MAVAGRGEFFVRDSGGRGPAVLLLHGWMFSADLNWRPVYEPLHRAGYRVIALDHRGHGRGLRSLEPFRLTDCAADAAAVMDTLGCGPALVVGYSMGGPIAQLMARDHPASVAGLVLCATSQEWRDLRLRLFWSAMGLIRLLLAVLPHTLWPRLLRTMGLPDGPEATWAAAELTRGNARDLAEAGRELGRFDSRPWAARITQPAAVVLTTRDTAVAPAKQRAL